MNRQQRQSCFYGTAFTLIEVLTVLLLTAALMTVTLQMYHQVRRGVSQLTGRLDDNRLAQEVLQKIAEDLDRLAAPGFDATVRFGNKYDNGLNSAQLTLENKYYGKGAPPKAELYDRVVWQTMYDSFAQSLILYRMHDGLNLEDKVVETGSDVSPSAGLYIPVAEGLTHFQIQSQQGETMGAVWTADTLPTAVLIGVSFAPPEELADGRVGVPDEKILYRTVAIDRTRFIPYQFIKRALDTSKIEDSDPNSADPNDAAVSTKTGR